MSNGLRQIPVGEPDWTLRRRDRTTAHVPAAQEDRPRDPGPVLSSPGVHVLDVIECWGRDVYARRCSCGAYAMPTTSQQLAEADGCPIHEGEEIARIAQRIKDRLLRDAQAFGH